MRHAIGNALLTNIILTMIVVIIAVIAVMSSYSKAYRIKNNLVNYIEKNGFNQTEIDAILKDVGYRINPAGKQDCKVKTVTGSQVMNSTSNYRYCVVKYTVNNGYYYGVTSYVYFDIPVVNSLIEYPIYGETKIIYSL